MPFFLALLTFAVIIGISTISEYMKRGLAAKSGLESLALQPKTGPNAPPIAVLPATDEDTSRVEGYVLPDALFYHQGHAWVALQEGGTAVIGIDEFASKFVGRPDSLELPQVGDLRRQGEKGWSLSNGKMFLNMLFPLDGDVIAVNERVISNPEILAEDPYGTGWLVMVKTRDLKQNLHNLLRGSFAKRRMEESATELRSVFSGRLGVVFQDGGLPEEGLADSFDEADWRTLVNRIFTFEPEDPDQ